MDYTLIPAEALEWVRIGLLVIIIIILGYIALRVRDIASNDPP